MKLRVCSSIFLFALTSATFASPNIAEPATLLMPAKFYVGFFVGGGSSNNIDASQFGTAYYIEAQGGPLAVNAFGHLSSESTSFYGAQIGYQTPSLIINSSQWTLGPAVELEGYSMSNSTFKGDLSNNNARLSEHDFMVSYPMSRNIFLINAVLNVDHPRLMVHPYVGFGIGEAILRITGANAIQTSPAEPGVNHYNTSTNDTNSTFAGQIKFGLGYDINKYVSLFAEYRWLYLASTQFTFGSTAFPGHPETSSWQVTLDSQRYNMGDIGVRFNF